MYCDNHLLSGYRGHGHARSARWRLPPLVRRRAYYRLWQILPHRNAFAWPLRLLKEWARPPTPTSFSKCKGLAALRSSDGRAQTGGDRLPSVGAGRTTTTSSKRMMKCVKGEGLPRLRAPIDHGNLFIVFTIEFPDSIDPEMAPQLLTLLNPPKHVVSAASFISLRHLPAIHFASSHLANLSRRNLSPLAPSPPRLPLVR